MLLGTNYCVCDHVSRGIFWSHAVKRKTVFSSRRLNQPPNTTTYSSTSFHTPTTAFCQAIDPKTHHIRNTPFSNSHKPFIRKSETKMGLLDLEKQFAFYGAYHSNPTNVAIHILFVWPILFTAQIILHFTPTLLSLGFLPPVLVLNWGFFATVFYALFYIALDTKAGSFTAFLTFFCWITSSFVANSLGFSLAWKVVLAAQLFCWTGQFIGHGVFEKRAPALLDNLAQAFLMAPFFVVLEVLQSSVGYEPYPGFKTRVKARIDSDIKEWKDKKQKKHS